jgi:hypothetical protein
MAILNVIRLLKLYPTLAAAKNKLFQLIKYKVGVDWSCGCKPFPL